MFAIKGSHVKRQMWIGVVQFSQLVVMAHFCMQLGGFTLQVNLLWDLIQIHSGPKGFCVCQESTQQT